MNKKFIKGGRLFLEDGVKENLFIEITDGKITAINKEPPKSGEILDYSKYALSPGFVDTHMHGYGGYDAMDLKAESIDEISKGIIENGVTSFFATTLTAKTEELNKACRIIGEEAKRVKGAKCKGIFLEGPFFTTRHKGAQNPSYFCPPDIEKLRKWKEESGGLVKKIAIAAEYENACSFIKEARKIGVFVALGHSDATYEEGQKAIRSGATIFVHTYNGMSGLHHRKPGLVGAALTEKNVYAELILDGHHVHPAAADVVVKCRRSDGILLVTDSMRAAGLGDGTYKLGDLEVVVKEGAAVLSDGSSLAGSVLKLSDAVKNAVTWGLLSEEEAIKSASLIPARSVGMDGEIGSLSVGKCADINVLDEKLNVIETFVDGEKKSFSFTKN